jgi:FdhD protein
VVEWWVNDTDLSHAAEAVADFGNVVGFSNGASALRAESVAREEPLEIRLAGFQVAVTMRTPGHDFDLVTGFLLTEAILDSASPIDSIAYCPDEAHDGASNIVNVNLRDSSSLDPSRWQRNFYASSSCGICGKASIEAVRLKSRPVRPAEIDENALYRLQANLRDHQPVFDRTGGLHAAALADLDGNILEAREDIGRHNAVDKVVGAHVRAGREGFDGVILIVSGRASFEVVQKALMIGISTVVAVSAPSSLAVELARDSGMLLVGFLRDNRCNVYAGAGSMRSGSITH